MRSTPVVVSVVLSLVAALVMPPAVARAAQESGTLSGTAKKEAKRPYTNYIVRARQVDSGQLAASVPLDGSGNFLFTGLSPAPYLMELVNGQNKVVCTAGPFTLATFLSNVSIDCHRERPSAAWLLLGAAAAAGITAAVLAAPPASPSR